MGVKTANFSIGDRVIIDHDKSILGVITAICIRGQGANVTYEVSYMHNGSSHSPWIEEWRLKYG